MYLAKRSRAFLSVVTLVSVAAPAAYAQKSDEGITLEEIVVTAEKREESLQKTALAITALSAEALTDAGVSQAEDLNQLVPGLGIGQGGPSTTVYMRGVGNYSTNAFADPAVAFNIDGVYVARVTGLSGNFFDVARVEVLKGPQGTLYGRNATGGAINLISNKPSTQEFAGGVGLELGNYDLVKANGFLNMPVSNTFAVRVAGQRTKRDGYQTDGNDDDDTSAARLGVRFEPSDAFSLQATGNYLHLGGNGAAHVPKTSTGYYDNSNPWIGQSIAATTILTTRSAFLYAGVNRALNDLDVTVKGITGEANADLGAADLTVVANYMSTVNGSKFFGPGFMVDNNTHSKQNSLETRLAGTAGVVKWVGGLYYFAEKQSENYLVDQGYNFNQTGVNAPNLRDTTYAGFGQATINMSERARLTLGARYTHEKKSQDGEIFSKNACVPGDGRTTVSVANLVAAIPQAAANGFGVAYTGSYCRDVMTGSTTWKDTSWKAGFDFDITDASMLYTTISRGFKAGGYFAAGDHAVLQRADGSLRYGNSYEPEKLIAYAVGSKNRFLADRVQLNGEAFYWDYKDHQESYLGPTTSTGAGFNFVTQQADARIYGVEIEADALLSDYDKLGMKLQYLKAEYTDAAFITASPAPGNPTPINVCTRTQNATTPAIWYSNCNGQQMPRSPTLSGSLDYSHTFELANGGGIVPSVNAQYSSSYWPGVDYNPLQKQDAYAVYGADIGYHAPDEVWSLTAWGANLGNEVVYTNAFMYPGTGTNADGGVAMVQLRAPRTYGVRFSAKF